MTRMQVSLSTSGDRSADVSALQEFTALVTEPIADMMPYWEK